MANIKTYEEFSKTGNFLDYDVNDIVICVKENDGLKKYLNIGDEYEVLKIYQLPEDKFLKNDYMRVDVKHIETGIISKGWKSTLFKSELEYYADEFNLL